MGYLKRCFWVEGKSDLYVKYHDEEWGVPVYDDKILFEMLCLEGQQAGLSWETVLNKREEYRKVFFNFDVKRLAIIKDDFLINCLENQGLIRSELKLKSIKKNAVAFIKIQEEFGSFNKYIWGFSNGKIINEKNVNENNFLVKSELSERISKDLKKRGFSFVGPVIIYAYLQAIGIINSHCENCFKN